MTPQSDAKTSLHFYFSYLPEITSVPRGKTHGDWNRHSVCKLPFQQRWEITL